MEYPPAAIREATINAVGHAGRLIAREHWVHEGENPPVGLILCARKDEGVARYALDGLPNKVMAAEYRTALPEEKTLDAEIRRTQGFCRNARLLRFRSGKRLK